MKSILMNPRMLFHNLMQKLLSTRIRGKRLLDTLYQLHEVNKHYKRSRALNIEETQVTSILKQLIKSV